MKKETIEKMRFNELIQELEKKDNCCVDCTHFIVRDLHNFVGSQKEHINFLIENKVNLKTNSSAMARKRNLIEVLKAIQDHKNIYKLDELPVRKIESFFLKKMNK